MNAIVAWSLDQARIIVALAAMVLAYGAMTVRTASYDVFPEFVPAQAEFQTEAPGLSARRRIEQLVTRPIEQAVAGRRASRRCARNRSRARIPGLGDLQAGFGPLSLAPDRGRGPGRGGVGPAGRDDGAQGRALTSSTMDLLKIGFTSDRLSPAELRDLIQWTVRPRLLSAPGVARATVYGGETRRIEITRPARGPGRP